MKRVLYSLTIALLLFSLPGRGQSPTAPALGFNVFLQNGGTLITNETEGPVAMGGDMTLTGSSYQIATNNAGTYQVSGVTVSLLVGGKINYTAGNGVSVNSNGYVKIGNSTGSYVWYVDQNNAYSPIRITPGNNYNGSPRINLSANSQQLGVSSSVNPVFQSGLIDFTTAFNTMKASSTCMSGLTDNASLTNSNGTTIAHTNLPSQVKINLNNGQNVLNLTGTDMNNVTNFTFNNAPSASKWLIINVNAAGTFNWNAWTCGGISFANCPYVLFNFYNTTTLNIQGGGAIEGTVFAPYADITKTVNQANIEGQVIAKSYYHSGGENHYAVFAPSITGCGTDANFTINNSTQCLTGNSFVFTNSSTGSSLTYSWKFGDGGTSTSTNPTHTYSSAGTFEVKLKATGSGGVDSIIQYVTVNPMVTPSVSISANPGTTVCSGSSVTFTATPVNGGTPSYQWKKNGSNVGSNSATYTTSSLSNNDEITCVMTSTASCKTASTATSNSLVMTVNSNATPYVLIWPLNTGLTTEACAGSPLTIAAYPFNGGSSPSYQWYLNGLLQGSDSSKLVINSPVDNDAIFCIMTSNASCITTPIDTSNTVVMQIDPQVTPTVTVSANTGTSICPSTSVTFTATPTNEGSSPTYQWKKNGSNVGSGGTTYTTSSISNSDVISCVLTSNASCATTATATGQVTMTVNPIVTPSVSISANPGTTVCSGSSVTFTATPTNGGASPSYQWKKNGINVGTNSATYTVSGLATGNTITCILTSNAPCVTTNTASSNTLTMTVNNTVTPSLTIGANPGTTVCAGTPITFSTTPTNGGASPAYQWKKNGAYLGNSSSSITINAPVNGDIISCEMTSNASCASPTLVTSNSLTLAVTPSVTPSVSISANPGTSICSGTSVTFTATPTNGGSTPAYQWKKNGANVGTNSATYTNASLSNNDVITCVLTSNASCATTTTATSNGLTMTITSPVTPSVTVSSNPTSPICAGTQVTFTATPVNGGSTPSYQWKKNGANEGTNSPTYITTTLNNNDVIGCVMTSNAGCTTTSTATSNNITMNVTTPSVPSVSISANPGNTVCAGTQVIYTAVPVNGGATPTYQWKKNGVAVGTNSASYTLASPATGDVIVCKMTTSLSCASPQEANSNAITMTVNPIVTPSVSISANTGSTICQGTPVTFTATPVNGGSTPSYQWKKNGVNVGTNSNTYTLNSPSNNDAISCIMTSNASCATTNTATSNTLTITVSSQLTPSVSIAASPLMPVCAGTVVTYTATPVNGGAAPSYQWKVNGVNVGGNNDSYTNSLSNNDVVNVVMTSNASCVSTTTATSNNITVVANQNVTPSVSIAANPGSTVCQGTSVSFTATPVNGGSNPSYQWKKNGNNEGTNSATYTPASLSNNDVISCIMTSNAPCATTSTATSNSVTMTVTPSVTPSVSISANPGTTICTSTNVTFTAVPVNGGSTPSYQWKKNGVNVGGNSATYSSNALSSNDVITCVMTSNASCATTATATSNSLTMSVGTSVTPSVTIAANPGNTVCANTAVTFTAAPVNGGSSPSYQWKKNGNNEGTNSATYSPASLSNNDVISCIMTSNASCASTSTATSNNITMSVGAMVTPSVTIGASVSGAICSGTPVTFTATPTNGGSNPSFQWKKNGVNDGANSASYSPASLSNNDVISCVMTSNASCVTTPAATSNGITMTVNSTVIPSVSISANPGATICPGTNVTFTAVPVNGGTTPSYQWKKNGSNVGSNASTYSSSALNNNDVISCVMTSNAPCASPAIATSNNITMNVGSSVTPSVSIAANPAGPICAGTSVSFTATPVNGGSAPSHQWKKNGANVGTNSPVYTDNGLINNDAISCVMTSNAGCVTTATANSNTITMTVNPPAAQPGAFITSSPVTYQGQVGVVYTVPNVAGVTYAWSYSGTGVTINGTGNSVTLVFGITATSGDLSVTASVAGGCAPSTPRVVSILVKPYMRWICQSGTNWNDATNWEGGFVPYGTISIKIPNNTSCQPSLFATNGSCRDLMVDSSAHLTIDTTIVLNVTGNVQLDGDVTGNGYVKLNGTTGQNIAGNGRIDNLDLDNNQGATINNGDTVHIGKHYKPTHGTLITHNGLELLSDSSCTATILSNAGSCNYISGDVICDKYIHGGRRAFRFFGHPYSQSIPLSQVEAYMDITGQGGAANGFTESVTNNPSAFWYNTLTGNGSTTNDSTGWIPFTNTDGQGANAWNPFEGVRMLVRGALGEGFGCCPYDPSPVTIKTHGPVNMCDVVVNCQTNSNAGFNLIGNPYAANVDLSQTSRGSAVGANFSVWDPNQGTSGAYVSQPFGFSYILPAYSAFVTNCHSATNNTITFHESDKTAGGSTGNLFKTTSGFGNNVVQLRILSNNDSLSWDRLLLFFDGQGLALNDPLDNQKLSNPTLDFYTFSTDAKPLSVDVRPFTNGEVIQLGLRAGVQQSYTIRVDDYDVPAGAQLYLHDKYLNQVQPLSGGMHYNFDVTSDVASQGDGRFEINVTGNPTSVGQVSGNPDILVNMMPNPATDNIVITYEAPKQVNTTVSITNLMGQQVYSNALGNQRSGSVNVSLRGLAQGVYMVHVTCGYQTITKRLIKN